MVAQNVLIYYFFCLYEWILDLLCRIQAPAGDGRLQRQEGCRGVTPAKGQREDLSDPRSGGRGDPVVCRV